MEYRKPGYHVLMYNLKPTAALENLRSWIFPTDFSLDVDADKLQ